MNSDVKYVVMENDIKENISLEKHFIKYHDETRRRVSIYCPLVAPRYLSLYIKENSYDTCYEVKSFDDFEKYKENIKVLFKRDDYYEVYTLIEYVNMLRDHDNKSNIKVIKSRKKRTTR